MLVRVRVISAASSLVAGGCNREIVVGFEKTGFLNCAGIVIGVQVFNLNCIPAWRPQITPSHKDVTQMSYQPRLNIRTTSVTLKQKYLLMAKGNMLRGPAFDAYWKE